MKSRIGQLMGDSHLNRIILLLYFGGRKSKTEIYRTISTNPRMPRKLEFLEDQGYITVNQEGPHSHPKNMVELTPLGSSLAEGLCMLEQTIGGDVGLMRAYASDEMTGSFEL